MSKKNEINERLQGLYVVFSNLVGYILIMAVGGKIALHKYYFTLYYTYILTHEKLIHDYF